jgi:hypothetical protein
MFAIPPHIRSDLILSDGLIEANPPLTGRQIHFVCDKTFPSFCMIVIDMDERKHATE